MKGWVKWDQEEWNEARAAFRNVLSSSDKSLRDQAKNAIEVLDSLEEAKNN
jgi:hypothetical protein